MFSINAENHESAGSEPGVTPRRGRPPGPTEKSAETRRTLYETATRLFAERGFEATTMRAIASEAGVSPGLLYRYFPGKRAVVLALYDELSARHLDRTRALPAGRWRERAVATLRTSLDVLGPHRDVLAALIPVLVSGTDDGLFATATRFSRERVERGFVDAVRGATDAPRGALAPALGRVLYLGHLAVLLWWLLDRSPGQRATKGLVALLTGLLPTVALGLKLPAVRRVITRLDALAIDALLGPDAGENPSLAV